MMRQLTETQEKVLDQLQGDLPDGPAPYDTLAGRVGIPVEEFLRVARELLGEGCLRKVSALINHVQAGFVANAMCVWNVPAERVDEAGNIIAGFKEVTHCYSRPASESWPYAIYCMIHGLDRQECEDVATRIAKAVRPIDYRILYSVRELKKQSLRFSF
jgi:DNA-binding Lrp family transcriptional regulator